MYASRQANAFIPAFLRKLGAPSLSRFGPIVCRSFHQGNIVIVEGSGLRGVMHDRSKSGKTFQVQIRDKIEHHRFDELRLWNPEQARVFINGDAMPSKETFQWLEHLCKCHSEVLIWKALGALSSNSASGALNKFERLPCLSVENVHVVQARSGVKNAADALLTALYGRHAQSDAMNYVLSDDKQWFSEIPHVFSDMPTVWLTFQSLRRASNIPSWRPAHWPPTWTTGTYVVACKADIQAGFRRKSSVIGSVGVGERIEVKEIARIDKDSRIRGRITARGLDGWVSLMDTEDRHIWALPACQ